MSLRAERYTQHLKLPLATIHHYTDTSEFVVCIYASNIKRFYNEQDNKDRNGSDESRK